jgi:hypothetical protein
MRRFDKLSDASPRAGQQQGSTRRIGDNRALKSDIRGWIRVQSRGDNIDDIRALKSNFRMADRTSGCPLGQPGDIDVVHGLAICGQICYA